MKTAGKPLPTRLRTQPIIDAVAEMRFATSVDMSFILPGFLLKRFPGGKVERLPAADVPDFVRASDENFSHQPLIRVFHDGFFFLVGSSSLAVGCSIPYPGWSVFQAMIQEAVQVVAETGMATAVTRHSLKYSDVLECVDSASALKMLDIDLKVAGDSAGEGGVNIHFTSKGESAVHLIQVSVIANLQLVDGTRKRGALISVDSISTGPAILFPDFLSRIAGLYSDMHAENKERFFSCLKEETLDQLGAEYV